MRGRENHSRHRFFVYRLILDFLLQQFEQIDISLLYICWQRTAVEGGEIEPLQALKTGETRFMTFLLPFLQLVHLLNNLLAHKPEGTLQHGTCLRLFICQTIQAHQHLRDGHRHVEGTGHLGPPRPRAVTTLQFL